jgi:hypothetical protein
MSGVPKAFLTPYITEPSFVPKTSTSLSHVACPRALGVQNLTPSTTFLLPPSFYHNPTASIRETKSHSRKWSCGPLRLLQNAEMPDQCLSGQEAYVA